MLFIRAIIARRSATLRKSCSASASNMVALHRALRLTGEVCPSSCWATYVAHNLSAEAKWVTWFEGRMALLIDKDTIDPTNYGGKDPQKYVTQLFLEQSILTGLSV